MAGQTLPDQTSRARHQRRSQRNRCHNRLYILLLRRATMKISYDSEIDALYIRLLEGKHECRSVRLSDEVALNIGQGEKLVGIEILDAKSVLGAGQIPAVMLEGLQSTSSPLVVREKPKKKYGA